MSLDFLNTRQAVHLPTGGDFAPSGFVSAWFAKVLFSFYAEGDITQYEDAPKYEGCRKLGNGFRYYYEMVEAANKARELLGIEINAQQVWSLRTEIAKVLNITDEKIRAKFSNPLVFDVNVTTLRSAKRRHELHMIALPAAVAAAATMLGYEHVGYDLSELTSQDAVYTDEFQAKMIGSDKNYAESVMWQRRAALWKSLGEEDATVYQPIGAAKFATQSEKLSECLGILAYPWTQVVWARVIAVPDPRADAAYSKDGNEKRPTIPAITQIFENEKAAQAVVKAELAARDTKHGSNGKTLVVPEAWAEIPDDWKEQVEKLKAEFAGKPLPIVKRMLVAREGQLAAKAEEVLAWVV